MKKIFYLAIALTVLFAACKKEQINSIDKKIVMSGMSEIESDITDFLEKIDEPIIDSLPVNDAVFFLEAGFNYRYAHAGNDLELTTTRIDTSYVNLQVVESYSTYTNLKSAFDDIYDEMSAVFDAIEDEEKALNILQITLEDDNTLTVISVWRYSTTPFGGDWYWGWKAGKCDNTRIGRDATDAIRFFHSIFFISDPLPYGLWTNVSFSNIYYAQNNLMDYLDDPNPYGYDDKLLFKHIQNTSYVTHCMAEEENVYYAELLPTAISRIKNNEGITNYFMNVFFVCKQDLISYPSTYKIQHGIQLIHGDWVSTNNIPWDDFSTI